VHSVGPCSGNPGTRPLAVVTADRHRVWTVGDGGASPVWTELVPLPSTVADVVGGAADWSDPTAPVPGFHVFTVGTDGRVRARTWEGRRRLWRDHRSPTPAVAVRSGVGAVAGRTATGGLHVVLLGSDDGLWHGSRSAAGWSWTAHAGKLARR
jgi:hypothetical protein